VVLKDVSQNSIAVETTGQLILVETAVEVFLISIGTGSRRDLG